MLQDWWYSCIIYKEIERAVGLRFLYHGPRQVTLVQISCNNCWLLLFCRWTIRRLTPHQLWKALHYMDTFSFLFESDHDSRSQIVYIYTYMYK